MNARNHDETFGLRPMEVRRVSYYGLHKPLTEEQRMQNRDNELNIPLHSEYNDLRQKLINTLRDKIFLADSLALRASQISSDTLHVSRHRIEYEEDNEELPLPERKRNIRNRLADASLT